MSDVMGGASLDDPRAEYVPIPETPGWRAHHHMAATPVQVEVTFPDGRKGKFEGLFRSYRNRPGDSPVSDPGWTEWEIFGQLTG